MRNLRQLLLLLTQCQLLLQAIWQATLQVLVLVFLLLLQLLLLLLLLLGAHQCSDRAAGSCRGCALHGAAAAAN
jgi:hypothetical protein